MAREVLDRYHDLDDDGRRSFFEVLARDFGPDRDKLAEAIKTWQAQPGDGNGSNLHFASEPRRQELIRRLNRAPGGTGDLVAMRSDLLTHMNGRKDSPRSTAMSSICSARGSTGGFSCCAG